LLPEAQKEDAGENMTEQVQPTHVRPHPGKAFIILLVIVAAVAGYIGLCTALNLTAPYGGFLFALYFLGLKGAAQSEFWPTVLGALLGLCIAWLIKWLPAEFGATGTIATAAIVLMTIYGSIMGWAPWVINNAAMLYLTVGTIPVVQTGPQLFGMALAMLLLAGLTGVGMIVGAQVARVRSSRGSMTEAAVVPE
jgi:hypothetical protein